MRKLTKRSATVAVAVVVAVGGGTAAFAYASGWFQGDASAAAGASSIQNVHATIVLDGSVAANRLYPGRTVQISSETVNNPNDYPVKIDGITVTGVSTGNGACGISDAKLSFGAVPANTTIPAGQSPATVNLGTLSMGQDASAGCAGVTFTITASLTGEIAG